MFQRVVSNQLSQLQVALVMAEVVLAQMNQDYKKHLKKPGRCVLREIANQMYAYLGLLLFFKIGSILGICYS